MRKVAFEISDNSIQASSSSVGQSVVTQNKDMKLHEFESSVLSKFVKYETYNYSE